jgi:thiol-disulfide isomerase/thioredoxin
MTLSSLSFAFAATLLAATAAADIPTDPNEVQPLPVGARAPAFSVRTKDGAVRTFSPGGYHKPTIVIFYRGGWCPYCNTQLNDLRRVEPKLRASGFEIVFLSTDRPAILYTRASGQGSVANNTHGMREVYRGSKAALNMCMRSFAARHGADRRSMVLMAPGWVRTEMGGPDGRLAVEESVPGVVSALLAVQGKPGLQYLDYLGHTVPW